MTPISTTFTSMMIFLNIFLTFISVILSILSVIVCVYIHLFLCNEVTFQSPDIIRYNKHMKVDQGVLLKLFYR